MSAFAFSGCDLAAVESVMPVATGNGAGISARQGRLSGRPSCRIFPLGRGWGLEIERTSAWLVGLPLPGSYRYFRSLSSAIAFAVALDLDYRVVRPASLLGSQRRRRRAPGARAFRRTATSKDSAN